MCYNWVNGRVLSIFQKPQVCKGDIHTSHYFNVVLCCSYQRHTRKYERFIKNGNFHYKNLLESFLQNSDETIFASRILEEMTIECVVQSPREKLANIT